jgi:hypothetical protein
MTSEIEIVRGRFRLRCDPAHPRVWLDLGTFSQPLAMEISVDLLDAFDRSVAVAWTGHWQRGDCERLTWSSQSTNWHKTYVLDVHADHLEFYADVRGDGLIDSIRYFDAIPDSGFRPHFGLTKHFNDKKLTSAREYSAGSAPGFRHVFCPEPNSYARQFFRPFEYAQVSVNADLDYCGGNFVANPGPLAFAVASDPDQEWLAFGLRVDPGEYHLSEYEYLGGDGFALNINMWGACTAGGSFSTPRMVIVPGGTAQDAISRYTQVLRDAAVVPVVRREQPGWWGRPIVCGWGHQCYQADLFRIRSSPERPPDNAAYTLSTEANYRDLVARLDHWELPWGTLVIDARWFTVGGLKNVDVGRWPDLRGFIDEQHRQGRRVLLWWGPWDPEGIPADQCIRYQPSERSFRQNRPGRLSKFGVPTPGKKLAIDITVPANRERIRDQVRQLLGTGPGEFNADGFKIDHVSAAPGVYDMVFPSQSRRLFGIEALREYLTLLYQAAKDVKPDALLIGQSPNPYLADVQDMLRLGDIYARHADSVLPEMTFRADMARIADQGWLIDTDGWPLPSLSAFREYVDAQPALGVPSLYYATHLDTTGEGFTANDYSRLRKIWSAV